MSADNVISFLSCLGGSAPRGRFNDRDRFFLSCLGGSARGSALRGKG
ncbi:hypothetical protein KUC_0967 [Vreelandella boliviensis LC1]|uniref:Uncharacterized protein n=1 Tax=Vreelandella boliviensis LC1 TaxID=1072583 RepID=A0A7U9C2K4_9GAMM|nr:hypothetical protein KUC_0967 [Halomonas boliviensis LC1]